MEPVDVVVVGAGVVGLAVARELARAGREVLVLERAAVPGSETSSRNSEVIHAGIYYPPGSLKARLCVAGRERLYAYCRERGIGHARCGKFIVATSEPELETLRHYRETARANGVADLEVVSAARVLQDEPEVRCVAALWSPSTGIVDSHELLQALVGDLEATGGAIAYRADVRAIELGRDRHRLAVVTDGEEHELAARVVVNAAGLHAPDLARVMQGLSPECAPRAYYAKGHYYTLSGRAPFRRLVYPVAVAGGLGVHVTLDLAGGLRFGPDLTWIDRIDYSFDDSRREAFAAAIRRYWPALDVDRLQPGYTGIRPKISGPGSPAADFRIDGPSTHGWAGLVNLFGIESPGLTASLALAAHVAVSVGVLAREGER